MHNIRWHFKWTKFCALLLLFIGCHSAPVEDRLLLPVSFSSVPDGFVLTSFFSDRIEIKIRGQQKLIDQINKENIAYPVDLYTDLELDPAGASTSIEPGVYMIPLIKKRIPVHPSIVIMEINPSYLSVKLERKLTKKFNILVPYTNKPATGHIALEAKTSPATVELAGAESIINAIETLKTKPLDLTGLSESFKKELPLDIDESLMIIASDPVITASVQIIRQLVAKRIENIPIKAVNCDGKPSISPAHITIEVKGAYDDLNKKDIEQQIFSYIDLKDLSPGVYVRNAFIDIPVGLIMTQAEPEVFTVKIK